MSNRLRWLVGRGRQRALGISLGDGPIAWTRPHPNAVAPDPHVNLMKLPVRRRQARVVAEQVVGARILEHLLQARHEVVRVDDGAAIGPLREQAQRVLRPAEGALIGVEINRGLIEVELENG